VKIVCHREDCAALIVIPGELHACTCPTDYTAALGELVEAAEDRDNGRPGRYTQRVDRLDAALGAFRSEKD
jgi:hypothetical protein